MQETVQSVLITLRTVVVRGRSWSTTVSGALLLLALYGMVLGQGAGLTSNGVMRPVQGPETILWPLHFKVEPKGKIAGPGPAALALTITPAHWNANEGNVKITVRLIGRLAYRGEMEWVTYFPDTTSLHRELQITIPPNDTSGIELSFQSVSMVAPLPAGWAFFVVEGDSVKFFRGDPRGFDVPHPEIPIGDRPPQGRRVKGEFPHWDSLYPIPEDTVKLPKQTRGFDSKSVGEHQTQRMYEQSPLTDQDVQIISVDGQTLVRRRGESKFHLIEVTNDTQAFAQKRHDSAMVANRFVTREVWLDLHSPDDLEFARTLIDSLMPSDTAGIYRGLATKTAMNKLAERKIAFRLWGATPHARSKSRTPRPSEGSNAIPKRGPRAIGSANPQSQLFFEGFEYAFPGSSWSIGDLDSRNGYDYWGDVYWCEWTTGFYSGWCSGNGDMPECDQYDNYMDAYMRLVQPVNVANKTNIKFNFSYLYDVEETYDQFDVYYSWDGVNWNFIICWDGYSGANMQDASFQLPANGNNLYIKYEFISDASNPEYYGGVYLDDIEITADPVPQPNLVPYWPAGWSSEIVASPVPGTNTNGTLYAGEAAYFDVAVKNTGTTSSGSFYTGVYADGSEIGSEWNGGLSSLEWCGTEDVMATLGTGVHTIKVKADINNSVAETNESDNEYSTTFTWQAPYLTFSGWLSYWDMNPAAHTVPLKNVTIELRDWDASGTQLLATATTGNDGRFFFPSVYNAESDGDGHQQDIFFRVYADNGAAYLTSGGGTYTYDFSVVNNHRSGSFDTTLTVSQAGSLYFYPISMVKIARDQWCTVRSSPGKAHIMLAADGTHTDPETATMYIDSSDNPDLGYPDTYDKDVIDHEYGHWLADHYFFLDWGGAPQHNWTATVSLETAAGEAFAHLFSSWISGNPLNVNRYSNFTQRYERNMENGEWGYNGSVSGSVNNWGRNVEGSVAGMFWDIYDQQNDDYSTFGDPTCRNCPDGIGDTLWNGIGNIFAVLADRSVSGHHPRNIKEFWDAWFQPTSYGHTIAMCNVYYEHGDRESCCMGVTGNVDMIGIVDLGDLNYLVHYLTLGTPPLPCYSEANVNGAGIVDMANLSALTSYLTGGGFVLPSCPQ